MTDYSTLYADADQMTNHWWWRPGWHVGTRLYAWHLTLDGQDELQALMDSVQAALADVPTLDPVPRQWRHITLTGMGHTQDVRSEQRDEAVAAVREAVADLPAITATFSRIAIFREAIAVIPDDPEPFTVLQNTVQRATAATVPAADEHNPGFRAHASSHYSNRGAAVAPTRNLLDSSQLPSTHARFDAIDLICMNRDRRMCEWESVATVPCDDWRRATQ